MLSYRKREMLLEECRDVCSVNRNTSHFPDSSVGKESACNAGDPGSIPGSGRFTGERIGYPFQYSWASLVAQLVKNLPTMRETWVGKIPWKRERHALQYSGLENCGGCKKWDTNE